MFQSLRFKILYGVFTFALIGAAPALAACDVSLRDIDETLKKDQSSVLTVAGEMRILRNAAIILKDNGKEPACESVVAVIQEMAANTTATGHDPRSASDKVADSEPRDKLERQATQNTAPKPAPSKPGSSTESPPDSATKPANAGNREMRSEPPAATIGGQGQPSLSTTQSNPRFEFKSAFGNATSALGSAGEASARSLIGATVYSATDGSSLGEIEDIIVAAKPEDMAVIVGYGGFLGLGEVKIKVKMAEISVNPRYSTAFVKLTPAQVKELPAFERRNGQWIAKTSAAK